MTFAQALKAACSRRARRWGFCIAVSACRAVRLQKYLDWRALMLVVAEGAQVGAGDVREGRVGGGDKKETHYADKHLNV